MTILSAARRAGTGRRALNILPMNPSRSPTARPARTRSRTRRSRHDGPNVLVPDRPATPARLAKLTDFGVAYIVGGDALTRSGDVVGTAASQGRPGPAVAILLAALLPAVLQRGHGGDRGRDRGVGAIAPRCVAIGRGVGAPAGGGRRTLGRA